MKGSDGKQCGSRSRRKGKGLREIWTSSLHLVDSLGLVRGGSAQYWLIRANTQFILPASFSLSFVLTQPLSVSVSLTHFTRITFSSFSLSLSFSLACHFFLSLTFSCHSFLFLSLSLYSLFLYFNFSPSYKQTADLSFCLTSVCVTPTRSEEADRCLSPCLEGNGQQK